MAALLIFLILLLLLAFFSSPSMGATYCLCKDGPVTLLQSTLDYACGAGGADCNPIQKNGACYNPNTVKDHCNYAVNSYFQRHSQASGTCDFSGTATTSLSPPALLSSTCVFPSSSSSSSVTTTPTTTVPATANRTTPASTTPASTTPASTTPVFGSGLPPLAMTDNNAAVGRGWGLVAAAAGAAGVVVVVWW